MFVEHQSMAYHPDQTGYEHPKLLPPEVASKIIEHLKRWCQRAGVTYE